jgi:hypothetical protein
MNGMDVLRAHRGSISKAARALGINQSAVSQWKNVPAEYLSAVEAATGIPRYVLRPDICPPPAQGPELGAASPDPGRRGLQMSRWQAAMARHRFAEIIDAAVAGEPQFVQRRDGKEVVVVSREYFERTKPNIKSYLLSSGYSGDGESEFDAILESVRANFPDMLADGRPQD